MFIDPRNTLNTGAGFITKDKAAAEKIAAEANANAVDADETYEVRPFQGGRYVVAMLLGGKVEMYI